MDLAPPISQRMIKHQVHRSYHLVSWKNCVEKTTHLGHNKKKNSKEIKFEGVLPAAGLRLGSANHRYSKASFFL
jgi:hypothetical protein